MNIRTWTEEEKRYLRDNYKDTPLADLGMHLHVAASTVREQLHRMGLKTDPTRRNKRSWSLEEIDYLRKNFHTMTAGDIADHIGCSSPTVSNKARELGLKKSPDWRKSDYYLRYVRNYIGNNRKIA